MSIVRRRSNIMAVIGFVVVALFVALVLSGLPNERYRCSCGFETYNELEALGHEKQHSQHKTTKVR